MNDTLAADAVRADSSSPVAESEQPYIEIQGVTKKFGSVTAVDDVSLDIYAGELFSLLGPSGCGKTTLLRMLAGLERPTSGRIVIDGQDLTNVPPYERPVNMMFQSYALFPHMTVEKNVAFGLRQEKMGRAEVEQRVRELLELVQLEDYGKRKPAELSGGQSQRVALARSLAKRPKLLLLDEPLAALDKKLREETQFELMNVQDQTNVTFIVVTHDQEEAMTLSTRIAVMNEGVVQQVGTATEVYEFPETRYVADFLGSINMFEGVVADSEESECAVVEASEAGITLHVDTSESLGVGSEIVIAIRPEKIDIGTDEPEQTENRCQGKVVEVAYQGSLSIYRVKIESGKIVRVTMPNHVRTADRPIDWNDEVWLSWGRHAGVVLHD